MNRTVYHFLSNLALKIVSYSSDCFVKREGEVQKNIEFAFCIYITAVVFAKGKVSGS